MRLETFILYVRDVLLLTHIILIHLFESLFNMYIQEQEARYMLFFLMKQ